MSVQPGAEIDMEAERQMAREKCHFLDMNPAATFS